MLNPNQRTKLPLGAILKAQRQWIGYTQKEVAAALGIPYQDYQKYEYNLHRPKRKRFKMISKVLRMPLTDEVYKYSSEERI